MFSQIISSSDIDSNIIKTFPSRCFPGRLTQKKKKKRSSLFPSFQGSFSFGSLDLGCVQVHEKERRLPFGKLYLIL